MNRYELNGIVADAAAGKQVVIRSYQRDNANTFKLLAEACEGAGATAHRANGRERYDLPSGGSIRFVSTELKSIRGLVCDVLLTPRELVEATDRDLIHLLNTATAELILTS